MDKKTRPIHMLPPRYPPQTERYTQTKWKVREKIFHGNGKEKKARVAVLISNEIQFITKAIERDKEGHYLMIKGTMQQEDITLVNICPPNGGALKYVKQILMDIKGDINRNTVIVGDFNTTLTSMDRCSRQKINKGTVALNNTLHQIDFIDIFKAFHP